MTYLDHIENSTPYRLYANCSPKVPLSNRGSGIARKKQQQVHFPTIWITLLRHFDTHFIEVFQIQCLTQECVEHNFKGMKQM